MKRVSTVPTAWQEVCYVLFSIHAQDILAIRTVAVEQKKGTEEGRILPREWAAKEVGERGGRVNGTSRKSSVFEVVKNGVLTEGWAVILA